MFINDATYYRPRLCDDDDVFRDTYEMTSGCSLGRLSYHDDVFQNHPRHRNGCYVRRRGEH